MTRRYLGDGVYAEFDGYQVWCETEVDGFRHRIAFDSDTLAAMVVFDQAARSEWRLTAEQSRAFVEALDNPPEPNDALTKAAEKFKAQEP